MKLFAHFYDKNNEMVFSRKVETVVDALRLGDGMGDSSCVYIEIYKHEKSFLVGDSINLYRQYRKDIASNNWDLVEPDEELQVQKTKGCCK